MGNPKYNFSKNKFTYLYFLISFKEHNKYSRNIAFSFDFEMFRNEGPLIKGSDLEISIATMTQ